VCGVVGMVSSRAPIDPRRVDAALEALAHRGPDGRGTHRSDDGRVALGHTRLALRDLHGGAQPMFSEDRRVVAVVNGELYGVRALAAELREAGHHMRSRSDSELVVHAWEQWGEAMLGRLRGEFAFFLYDAGRDVAFAARDRFGVKPLAWTMHEGEVLVASQVRALVALGVPLKWDLAALVRAASFQYAGPSSTLFDGVHQLAAGCALRIEGGRVEVRRYWDLDLPREREAVDDRYASERVRSALMDAVRERLDADVPVAVQLSGGLDSTAVLACARAALGRAPDAFSVAFTGGGAYDERALAEATAGHFGSRLHVVPVDDGVVAELLPAAIAASEGACINAHAAAKLALSRAVRSDGYEVVLTGEGADEVFLGYAHFRSDLSGDLASVASTNRASSGLMLPDGDPAITTRAIDARLGFVPTWLRAKASFGARVHDLLRAEVRGRPDAAACDAEWIRQLDVEGQLAGRERVDQAAYAWTRLALEGYILRTLGDALEMSSGVEGRLPMLDGVLFDVVRALPTSLKIRGGVEKWVLRDALWDLLPEAVRTREKHPFVAPPLGPRTLDCIGDAFLSRAAQGQPLFSPEALRALLDRVRTGSEADRKANDPALVFAFSILVLGEAMGVS